MKQRTFRTWTLVPEYRNKIRNKWIERPVWFEAAQAHPPPYTYGYQRKAGKAKQIVFPEDKLKKLFLAKNPWAHIYKSRQFPNQNIFIDSPADVFAAKHIEYTNQGLPETKAYDKAMNYVEEMMYSLRLEKQLATEQVNARYPLGRTTSAEEMIGIAMYKYDRKFERLRTGRMKKTMEQVIRNKKLNKDTTPLTHEDLESIPLEQIDAYMDVFPEDDIYFKDIDEDEADYIGEEALDEFI